ncbi:hypothetical protein [Mycetocola reblochoni]|uniref:hypothetical protein n=1 Tax=Mycetocola reblochoni TaxID=331618 RepID=UPI003F97D2DE
MADAPATDLYAYVNAISAEDRARADQCQAEAVALVAGFVGERNPWRVPSAPLDRATQEVAAELYYRKGTRAGVAGFEADGGVPFRVGVDPLKPAYPLLRPFLPVAFA